MKSQDLLEKLNKFAKTFYTIADVQLITGQTRPVTRVLLNRLTADEKLIRLARNMYVTREMIVDCELIAQQLDILSYISFETALSRFGILSQIPYAITLATVKKSKTIFLGDRRIIYRKIKEPLFFGYFLENNLKIAYPEKALLDFLYLISRGKIKVSLKEMDFSRVNQTRLNKFIKKYPDSVKKISREIKLI